MATHPLGSLEHPRLGRGKTSTRPEAQKSPGRWTAPLHNARHHFPSRAGAATPR
jgi:hypothetical protein